LESSEALAPAGFASPNGALVAGVPLRDISVFTKNRQRLLEGKVAEAVVEAVLAQARCEDTPIESTGDSTSCGKA